MYLWARSAEMDTQWQTRHRLGMRVDSKSNAELARIVKAVEGQVSGFEFGRPSPTRPELVAKAEEAVAMVQRRGAELRGGQVVCKWYEVIEKYSPLPIMVGVAMALSERLMYLKVRRRLNVTFVHLGRYFSPKVTRTLNSWTWLS